MKGKHQLRGSFSDNLPWNLMRMWGRKTRSSCVSNYSTGLVTAVKACAGLICFFEASSICLHRFPLAVSAGLWHPVISWPTHFGVHWGAAMKFSHRNSCILRVVALTRKREGMVVKECPVSHHLLRNAEQHMLDMRVSGNYCAMEVIHGLYAPVRMRIRVHICAEVVEKWNRED